MGIDGEVLPPLSAKTLAEMELGRQAVERAKARLKAKEEAGEAVVEERPAMAHPSSVTLTPDPEPVPLPPPDEVETVIASPKRSKK